MKANIEKGKNLAASTKMLKCKPIIDSLNTLQATLLQLNLIRETKIEFLDRLDKKSPEYRYYINQIMTRKLEEATQASIMK